jgi:hypothetical protein
MDDVSFPSSLMVLLDDDDVPVNLIFMTQQGMWVRENGAWVEFEEEEGNPKRQFEDMQIAPMDPRVIDAWDAKNGDVSVDEIEDYEFAFQFPTEGA